MEISALSISLKISALWLECWNSLQDAFTALVFAGLIAEIFVVVVDWHEERVGFFDGILSPPKDPGISKLIFGLTGAMLVAVGVGGELWTHQRATIVEDDMQVAVGKLVAFADNEAGVAISGAGEANERASKNEREAARLRGEAESEKSARAKLEAVIQPRELKYPWALRYSCRKFGGHAIQVTSYALDAEGWRLGQEIISVLRNCTPFVLDNTSSISVMGGFETGVRVSGPDNEKLLKDSLSDALSQEHLLSSDNSSAGAPKASMQLGGILPDSKIVTVMVGVKPLPITTSPDQPVGQRNETIIRHKKNK